jgi:Na+/melibiose symporter-like transporter
MNQAQPLPLREKLGFLSFSTSNNIVYQFKSLYYLSFLTNGVGIPVLSAGTIFAIGSTADNLASKLATAGATQLVAVLLSVSGFDGEFPVQPEAALGAINFLLGWAPLAVSLLMLVVVFFLEIEKDMAAMRRLYPILVNGGLYFAICATYSGIGC